MRRLFWYGAAVSLMATAGMFLAGAAANHYPDSFLAKCVVVAYQLGTDYNPLYPTGHAMAEKICNAFHKEPATPQSCAVTGGCSRGPLQGGCPSGGQETQPIILGSFRPGVDFPLPSLVALEEAECHVRSSWQCAEKPNGDSETPVKDILENLPDNPGSLMFGVGVSSDEGLTGGVVVNERNFDVMPPAKDAPKEAAPAVMPYITDAEPINKENAVTDFWNSFFQTGASEEQSHQEPIQLQNPPDCREDPTYSQQYPGCPYSGSCPASGRNPVTTPSYPVEPNPTPKPARKPGHALETEIQMNSKGCEDCPPHPEVDTTEFRPSDAHHGEFRPFPL